MGKRYMTGAALCAILFCGIAYAAEENSPVEQYRQERVEKRAYERFLYAKEMLETSQDVEVVNEAVQDAVRYATNNDENQRALAAIETALERLPKDGADWREATLARGKMLARLDRKDDAEALFQNAVEQNWNHAMWRYSESLIESDDMADACLLECRRIAGLEKYKNYRGDGESLEIFLTLLRLTKDFDKNISLTADVANRLDDIADKPAFCRIARALCLAEDGEADLAVEMLEEINGELSEEKEHREYKHLPLYKASILFKEGKNYPAAQAAFTEFMNRNQGDNKKIIASALRLARDIEIKKEDLHKIDEFASFLIDGVWFNDESVRDELSDEDVAGLYDMQRLGISWSGDLEKSVGISKFVADTYPNTLAGVTCLRNYAVYIGYFRETQKESIGILNDILKKTGDNMLIASVRIHLANAAIKENDFDLALEHLQAALDNISPYSKGACARYRKTITERTDYVIQEKVKKSNNSQ